MKYSLIFILFFNFCFSQQKELKIIDQETGKPIAHARLTLMNKVLYTNDDGKVIYPENASKAEIFVPSYQKENIETYVPIVRLKPIYQNIEEVKITALDIKKIFEETETNYTRLYYSQPSLYDIIYKQKNFRDGKINLLLIADGKFWADRNMFNYKYALNNDYDRFVQIGLNNIKYFQNNETYTDIFQGSSLDRSKDRIGDLFFNFELKRVLNFMNVKDAKYSAHLTNETEGEQNIRYKIKMPSGLNIKGNIVYNKLDKTITHYEMEYDQSNLGVVKIKNASGIEYDFHPGNGTVIFDFYKKANRYIPAQAVTFGDYYIIYDGKKYEGGYDREITFQSLLENDKKRITNVVDFSKNIWENIPDHEKKDSDILLSREEQEFLKDVK